MVLLFVYSLVSPFLGIGTKTLCFQSDGQLLVHHISYSSAVSNLIESSPSTFTISMLMLSAPGVLLSARVFRASLNSSSITIGLFSSLLLVVNVVCNLLSLLYRILVYSLHLHFTSSSFVITFPSLFFNDPILG